MRQHHTVELEAGRRAIVRELRVRDMRHIMSIITNDELTRPVTDILRSHLPELLTLLDDSLQLPEGEVIDDLSLSECETIGRAWWELHRAFFMRAVGVIGARVLEPISKHSTAPA